MARLGMRPTSRPSSWSGASAVTTRRSMCASIISAAIAGGVREICAGWPRGGRRRRGGGPGLPLLPTEISRRRSCLRSDTRIALPRREVHRGSFCWRAAEARSLDATDALARAPYLTIAEMQGKAAATRILLAAPATEADFLAIAKDRIVEREELVVRHGGAGSQGASRASSRCYRACERAASRRVRTRYRSGAGGRRRAARCRQASWTKAQIQLRERSGFLQDRARPRVAGPDRRGAGSNCARLAAALSLGQDALC